MGVSKVKLRDLKRAFEDYQGWHGRFDSATIDTWDGIATGFKAFLSATPFVGEQILELARATQGKTFDQLFDESGGWAAYAPPADETQRLSLLARVVLEESGGSIASQAVTLTGRTYFDEAIDEFRRTVLDEFFEAVEKKLSRKIEDLEDDFEDSEYVPIQQIQIFATNLAFSSGSGDISFTVNNITQPGIDLLLKKLTELEAVIAGVAEEQRSAAIVAECDQLLLQKRLGEIRDRLKAGDTEKAASIWEEIKKQIPEKAGNIVDTVTMIWWMFQIARGVPPM